MSPGPMKSFTKAYNFSIISYWKLDRRVLVSSDWGFLFKLLVYSELIFNIVTVYLYHSLWTLHGNLTLRSISCHKISSSTAHFQGASRYFCVWKIWQWRIMLCAVDDWNWIASLHCINQIVRIIVNSKDPPSNSAKLSDNFSRKFCPTYTMCAAIGFNFREQLNRVSKSH